MNDVASLDQKINDLVMTGEEMAQDGHFEQDQQYKKRLWEFKGMPHSIYSRLVKIHQFSLFNHLFEKQICWRSDERKSLCFHTYNFEIDNELQRIRERTICSFCDTRPRFTHCPVIGQKKTQRHKRPNWLGISRPSTTHLLSARSWKNIRKRLWSKNDAKSCISN